jgi:predicted dehydrogenase
MKVGIIGSDGLMGRRRREHLEPGDEVKGFDTASGNPSAHDRSLTKLVDWADAVVVAVPHDQLVPMALKAVRAGKPVLLEKPCARSIAEITPLMDAAATLDVPVVPAFTLRHYPGIGAAADLIAAREPVAVRMVYGHPGRPGYDREWRCDRERGGGQLLDQGVHLLDLACSLLNTDTVADYAEIRGNWGDIEDNVFIRLPFKQGSMCTIHASWTEAQPIFRLEVTCKAGGGFKIEGLGGGYGPHRLTILPSRDVAGWKETGWEDARTLALSLEWQRFKRDVAERKTRIEDAWRVLKLVDKCTRLAGR